MWMFFARLLAGWLALAGLAGCQSMAARQGPAEGDLGHFLGWFAGEYNNYEQVWQQAEDGVAAEDRHEHIHHIFKRVAAPAVGEHVFFVRQYMDGDYERVYRQRLYRFSREGDAIRLSIYRFADEARYRDTDQRPELVRDLELSELSTMPGCDVFWRWQGDHYLGEMREGACFYHSTRMKKDIYITDTLKLTADEIWIGDKAFDAEGNRLFGRDEPHKNRKVRYFVGWAAINNGVLDADSADPDGMQIYRGVRLHNEGQRLALIGADGADSGYRIELARLTEQRTGTAVLKLGLWRDGEEKAFTYTWTNPGAERVGINLRWMQVGLVAEAVP
ncbi:MAG: chromophore lyase CpcT/CpeT [Cellvibrionales bacterium]|nr:chromophore lyase CpcT/CpeT [Cellvibrionales bacterium]